MKSRMRFVFIIVVIIVLIAICLNRYNLDRPDTGKHEKHLIKSSEIHFS